LISSIDIERIHRLDHRILLIIAIIQPIFSLIVNYLFTIGFYKPLSVWSHHLINPTLQGGFIILLIFGFIIFKIGRHNFSSIWLNSEKLREGVIFGIIFWLLIQTSVAVFVISSENPLSFNPDINQEIGAFLGQLFGNALAEEFLFRGIFFLQLYIFLRDRFSDRTAFLVSIIASQLFFAVSHIPNRVLIKHYDNFIIDQMKLFIMGILFVIFYIRTKNFILTVIIHSLLNYQLRIFEEDVIYPLVALVLFVSSLIFWNQIKMKFGYQDN